MKISYKNWKRTLNIKPSAKVVNNCFDQTHLQVVGSGHLEVYSQFREVQCDAFITSSSIVNCGVIVPVSAGTKIVEIAQ